MSVGQSTNQRNKVSLKGGLDARTGPEFDLSTPSTVSLAKEKCAEYTEGKNIFSGRPFFFQYQSMSVHMPAEEKDRDSPKVKTQEMFVMRKGPATHYFN